MLLSKIVFEFVRYPKTPCNPSEHSTRFSCHIKVRPFLSYLCGDLCADADADVGQNACFRTRPALWLAAIVCVDKTWNSTEVRNILATGLLSSVCVWKKRPLCTYCWVCRGRRHQHPFWREGITSDLESWSDIFAGLRANQIIPMLKSCNIAFPDTVPSTLIQASW